MNAEKGRRRKETIHRTMIRCPHYDNSKFIISYNVWLTQTFGFLPEFEPESLLLTGHQVTQITA